MFHCLWWFPSQAYSRAGVSLPGSIPTVLHPMKGPTRQSSKREAAWSQKPRNNVQNSMYMVETTQRHWGSGHIVCLAFSCFKFLPLHGISKDFVLWYGIHVDEQNFMSSLSDLLVSITQEHLCFPFNWDGAMSGFCSEQDSQQLPPFKVKAVSMRAVRCKQISRIARSYCATENWEQLKYPLRIGA